ncbi:MAG: hypothetical protein HY928_11415 [Elusimicrobia bacterium]|nr:hypothetical protein [Elusimicrobiota bacterium]
MPSSRLGRFLLALALALALLLPPVLYWTSTWTIRFLEQVAYGSRNWVDRSALALPLAVSFVVAFPAGALVGRFVGGGAFLLLPGCAVCFYAALALGVNRNFDDVMAMVWLAAAFPSLWLSAALGWFLRKRAVSRAVPPNERA